MILGLGLDIAEISRIARSWERFGMRFAEKVLHPDELIRFSSLTRTKDEFLASRFAAKEATVKALGTGFRDGISPLSIAVLQNLNGKPELQLYGKALQQAQALGVHAMHISLTHGRETVAAVVILEGDIS